MANYTKIILAIVLLLSLCLPQGVFRHVDAASPAPLNNLPQYTVVKFPKAVEPSIITKPITPPPVVVVSSPANCKINFSANQPALQEGTLFNLNQQATNCFPLSTVQPAPIKVTLEVTEPTPLVTQVVVLKTSWWKAFSFHAGLPLDSTPFVPVLPLVGALFTALALALGYGFRNRHFRLVNQFARNLNLHQLRVLRC